MTAREDTLWQRITEQREYLNQLYVIEDEVGEGVIENAQADLDEMEDEYFNGEMRQGVL